MTLTAASPMLARQARQRAADGLPGRDDMLLIEHLGGYEWMPITEAIREMAWHRARGEVNEPDGV